MSIVKKENHTVGGIAVTVYGSPSSNAASSAGLAVLFLLHDRFGHAAEEPYTSFAEHLVAASTSESKEGQKDLLVVLFDQRNHGERTVDKERNKGWMDRAPKEGEVVDEFNNPAHLVDMYSIQTGTARDVSFLIDFLPSVLWPASERTVTDWWVSGVSLGGHSTWIALGHDPRLTLGIPIIGSPSYSTLLTHRSTTLPASLQRKLPNPLFSPHLRDLVDKDDPANLDEAMWKGKKILVLSGADDTLVPAKEGGTVAFVEKLANQGVEVKLIEDAGIGHAFSPNMRKLAAEFVLENLQTSPPPKSQL